MRATHPIELRRIRPLESRVRRKLQARFGEGRMEKDAVGFPRGQKNSDVRRTSPAAYSTAPALASFGASALASFGASALASFGAANEAKSARSEAAEGASQ